MPAVPADRPSPGPLPAVGKGAPPPPPTPRASSKAAGPVPSALLTARTHPAGDRTADGRFLEARPTSPPA